MSVLHVTCFIRVSVLIVEHEVWETLSHKELLHAVNLRKMSKYTVSKLRPIQSQCVAIQMQI